MWMLVLCVEKSLASIEKRDLKRDEEKRETRKRDVESRRERAVVERKRESEARGDPET